MGMDNILSSNVNGLLHTISFLSLLDDFACYLLYLIFRSFRTFQDQRCPNPPCEPDLRHCNLHKG
jgi:hypothetical protein